MSHTLDFRGAYSYAGRSDSITVPVILQTGAERVDILASLDTGASHCLFQRGYAEALGLVVERGVRETFATANSRFEAFGHELLLVRVFDIEIYTRVFFFADPDIGRNVLGRRGWLDRLRIGIVDHDQMLYADHYDS